MTISLHQASLFLEVENHVPEARLIATRAKQDRRTFLRGNCFVILFLKFNFQFS